MMISEADIQKFMIAEIESVQCKIVSKTGGREGNDYILTTNKGNIHEFHLKSINLDMERSVKISKYEFGDLKDNLWLALVLIIEKTPRILYLIPSRTFETPDDRIFFSNDVERMPQLSNWYIKIFSNAIGEFESFT